MGDPAGEHARAMQAVGGNAMPDTGKPGMVATSTFFVHFYVKTACDIQLFKGVLCRGRRGIIHDTINGVVHIDDGLGGKQNTQ
jgi:hypothetical protein